MKAGIIAAALALLALAALVGEDASFSIGGAVEARPFARISGWDDPEAAIAEYGSATALSLELDARGPSARAYASLEASILTGPAASDAWAAAASAYVARLAGFGLLDSTARLLAPAYDPGDAAPSALLQAGIRALYIKVDREALSLTAGRQVVKYQSCALWSPTDVYTGLDLSGVSPVRRGADALRLGFPLGATGALDLVAAPETDFSEGRYSARLSGFALGVDAAALGLRDGRPGSAGGGSWSAGASLKADLVVAIEAELLATWPDSGAPWLRAAVGSDYSLGDFVFAAEYYFNGGGDADPSAPGAHNAYASVSWAAGDFVSFAATSVLGLSKGTWSATLSASIDAAQNATVAAYALAARATDEGPVSAELGTRVTIAF